MSHGGVVKVLRHVAQDREVSNSGESRFEATGLRGHGGRTKQCPWLNNGEDLSTPRRYPGLSEHESPHRRESTCGVAGGRFTEPTDLNGHCTIRNFFSRCDRSCLGQISSRFCTVT
jgi:hypothetical protein